MRGVVAVLCLLAIAMVPVVQSSGGVINTVSIIGNGDVGAGTIEINISLIGVGGASSASVNWNASLTDLEGNIIDYDSGNSLVDDGVEVYVQSSLGIAPLGNSNLTIILTGDVGSPNSNQWIVYEETITKLRPLNVSIGEPIFNGVSGDGASTNNLTINDGDFAEVEIPIINSGDINWSGGLNMSVNGAFSNSTNLTIDGDETDIVSFIVGPFNEGLVDFEFNLFGQLDQYLEDNSVNSSIQIYPPPLPSIELMITRIAEPVAGGDVVWNLSAHNFGNSVFNGNIVCYFENDVVENLTLELLANNSFNTTISMLSKPGELLCTTEGARTFETINATDQLDYQSAFITGAGHYSPSLLNGPWHVGDEVSVSILVRNEGDNIGNVAIKFESESYSATSNYITLDAGMAGEITHSMSFEDPGNYNLNWSIISTDSAIEENLSGEILIPVELAQDITISVEDVTVSNNGIELSWSVNLAEGNARVVTFEYGFILDGDKETVASEEREVLSGVTFGKTNLGSNNADLVYVRVSAIGWVIGLGSTIEDQSPTPDYQIIPSITVNPITQPRVPKADDKVTIFYTLSNTGDGGIPQSEIIITDSSDSIIGIQTINSKLGISEDFSTVVDWPNGENVVVTVSWYVDGGAISDQILVKSELIEETNSGFELPLGGILGGLLLGMLAIFAIRMSNAPKSEKVDKKPKQKATPKPEKIEVSCPTCDRRLRVPSDYSGSVRCPECETKFDVEGDFDVDESEQEEESNEISEEVVDEPQWSSSDNDILGCPKCTRKLKVPYEKRPAKARCPACETIFEARAD